MPNNKTCTIQAFINICLSISFRYLQAYCRWLINMVFTFIYLCSPNEVWEHIVFTLFLTIIKVFRLQRKTLLLFFGFFFPIIIKVFRLQRKTLLLFFGFFFPIIIIILLTRFLRDAWTDFHEIFRDGRYWSGIENVEPDF